MVTYYEQYMIIYEEKDGKIVVKSIIANGNFQCMYGEVIYNSLSDLKADLAKGRYGLHPKC